MSSSRVPYKSSGNRFHLERLSGTTWTEVPIASFSYSESYNPDDNNTLIYGSETGNITISYYAKPAIDPLYATDKIRARYGTLWSFYGTVDSTNWHKFTTGDSLRHGGNPYQLDFTATCVGTYAALLGRTVCWTTLPTETAIVRIRRFVTVNGW